MIVKYASGAIRFIFDNEKSVWIKFATNFEENNDIPDVTTAVNMEVEGPDEIPKGRMNANQFAAYLNDVAKQPTNHVRPPTELEELRSLFQLACLAKLREKVFESQGVGLANSCTERWKVHSHIVGIINAMIEELKEQSKWPI